MRSIPSLAAGVGRDQAGVDREAFAADQTLRHAARHTVSNSCRNRSLSRNRPWRFFEKVEWSGTASVEAEPAEPAIGQVEMNLLAQPPLRADAEAVADDQHPDHQLGIDRGPAGRAVERGQMRADVPKIDEAVDPPQQMVGRHMILEGNS